MTRRPVVATHNAPRTLPPEAKGSTTTEREAEVED